MTKANFCPHGILGKKKCSECRKIYQKKWYIKNKERHLKVLREYRRKNRQKFNKIANNYYWKNREIISERKKASIKRLKLEVLFHYGSNPPKCACCGETIIEFLTIDHIFKRGDEHRKKIKRFGSSFYQWLKQNGFPDGYQVLCWNCNWGKTIKDGGICPHKVKFIEK